MLLKKVNRLLATSLPILCFFLMVGCSESTQSNDSLASFMTSSPEQMFKSAATNRLFEGLIVTTISTVTSEEKNFPGYTRDVLFVNSLKRSPISFITDSWEDITIEEANTIFSKFERLYGKGEVTTSSNVTSWRGEGDEKKKRLLQKIEWKNISVGAGFMRVGADLSTSDYSSSDKNVFNFFVLYYLTTAAK